MHRGHLRRRRSHSVEADGVHFSSDIYGHDEKLVAALDGKSLAW